jgi:hypothetical protein
MEDLFFFPHGRSLGSHACLPCQQRLPHFVILYHRVSGTYAASIDLGGGVG